MGRARALSHEAQSANAAIVAVEKQRKADLETATKILKRHPCVRGDCVRFLHSLDVTIASTPAPCVQSQSTVAHQEALKRAKEQKQTAKAAMGADDIPSTYTTLGSLRYSLLAERVL
eukprot:4670297-Amphidinium_carterae.1